MKKSLNLWSIFFICKKINALLILLKMTANNEIVLKILLIIQNL